MSLIHAISTVADGSMKTPEGNQDVIRQNRMAFLQTNNINPADTTLHTLSYDGDDYCRYVTLDESAKGDGIMRESTINADAVVVTQTYHGLLLPLADCVGAVIHDPVKSILMMSHLGRHNLEQHGGAKCIKYLVDTHGVNPRDLIVQLTPAAGRESYPLHAFDERGLQEVAIEQLMNGGVAPENIHASTVDTTLDPSYFSHSEFLQGRRDEDGRFAVIAMMS
jgi:copper oxidase (laccase) domain-containing protein